MRAILGIPLMPACSTYLAVRGAWVPRGWHVEHLYSPSGPGRDVEIVEICIHLWAMPQMLWVVLGKLPSLCASCLGCQRSDNIILQLLAA